MSGRNNKDRKQEKNKGLGGQTPSPLKPENKEKTLAASLKHLLSKAWSYEKRPPLDLLFWKLEILQFWYKKELDQVQQPQDNLPAYFVLFIYSILIHPKKNT